jgi:hypothetical protein
LTDVSPVDSSGRDVAAASTVPPKRTPMSPTSPAITSPLRSSTTPATRVSSAATLKNTAALAVLVPLPVARCSVPF